MPPIFIKLLKCSNGCRYLPQKQSQQERRMCASQSRRTCAPSGSVWQGCRRWWWWCWWRRWSPAWQDCRRFGPNLRRPGCTGLFWADGDIHYIVTLYIYLLNILVDQFGSTLSVTTSAKLRMMTVNSTHLAKSLPAVMSWLKEAFLMLFVSNGSKTESMTNTIWWRQWRRLS